MRSTPNGSTFADPHEGERMLTIDPQTDLSSLVSAPLGLGEWFLIDQARIDAFAAATADDQWLHTDPVKAAGGPYGRTIAHGFLVLSLLPALASSAMEIAGFSSVVNYGLNRVRFPAPTPVDSRVRDRIKLDAAETRPSGILLTLTHTVEVEDQDRPACVAQQIRLLTT
jgi:acyl dehydratase